MAKSFYVTLSSNSDSGLFPENTLTHFFNKFPYTLDLNSGEWEVGLVEIDCPFNWKTFQKSEVSFDISSSSSKTEGRRKKLCQETVEIPPGYYPEESLLVQVLNQRANSVKEADLKDKVKFRYDTLTRKCAVTLAQRTGLKLSEKLARVLGLKPYYRRSTTTATKTYNGKEIVDVDDGLHHLYIYSNVAEHRPVGHAMLPLLRIVPVFESKGNKPRLTTFQSVQYLPARKQIYDSLEIDIRTTTGEPVPFERGHVLVTLHFRQTR